MTLEEKAKIREGMALHCGGLYAVRADVLFDNLYTAKYGRCYEHKTADGQEEFKQRELKVYQRFMMWKVDRYDRGAR